MTHPVCRDDGPESQTYYLRLWERLLDPEPDLGTKLAELFETETSNLGLEHACLSRIDPENDDYHVEVGHSPDSRLRSGETLALSRTYCRRTVARSDGTLCIDDAADGWDDDPAYQECGWRTYVGTTVEADDGTYGTLCFANSEPRGEPLTEQEVALVEMVARWVSFELHQWSGPPTGSEESRSLRLHDVMGSSRLDAVLEAVSKHPRRLVLTRLLEGPVRTKAIAEEFDDPEKMRVRLRHAHLPKLEDCGYVDWDREAGQVTRGPDFGEAEHLLTTLGHGIEECHCE